MKLGKWSTTPGSNNATPPDGWPEGQAPSTVNDCAREMMASIRTAFNDLQFVDQDFTPTYINATNFTVAGNQTAAIHAGRRLKLFDGTTLYATVATASFTAVTTITVATDSGNLTSSLSSFAISVLANTNNALPRNTSHSVETMTIGGTLSVSGAAVVNGALSVGGSLTVNGNITATQVTKAWVSFSASGSVAVLASYNCSGVVRSAAGVYVISFANPFADTSYLVHITPYSGDGTQRYVELISGTTNSLKFRSRRGSDATVIDATSIYASFLR